MIHETSLMAVLIFLFFAGSVIGISFYLGRRAKSASGYFAAGGGIGSMDGTDGGLDGVGMGGGSGRFGFTRHRGKRGRKREKLRTARGECKGGTEAFAELRAFL